MPLLDGQSRICEIGSIQRLYNISSKMSLQKRVQVNRILKMNLEMNPISDFNSKEKEISDQTDKYKTNKNDDEKSNSFQRKAFLLICEIPFDWLHKIVARSHIGLQNVMQWMSTTLLIYNVRSIDCQLSMYQRIQVYAKRMETNLYSVNNLCEFCCNDHIWNQYSCECRKKIKKIPLLQLNMVTIIISVMSVGPLGTTVSIDYFKCREFSVQSFYAFISMIKKKTYNAIRVRVSFFCYVRVSFFCIQLRKT